MSKLDNEVKEFERKDIMNAPANRDVVFILIN